MSIKAYQYCIIPVLTLELLALAGCVPSSDQCAVFSTVCVLSLVCCALWRVV